MDLEDLKNLLEIVLLLYHEYKEWQNKKRSKDKGKPAKHKPKTALCGTNEETLNRLLYIRTGYRDIEQYLGEDEDE